MAKGEKTVSYCERACDIVCVELFACDLVCVCTELNCSGNYSVVSARFLSYLLSDFLA